MKKNLFTAILLGAVSMMLLSGCAFCRKPQVDSCYPVPGDHVFTQSRCPEVLTLTQPLVLPSGEVFRPVFRAGAKPVVATGIGLKKEIARNNAIVNFLKDNSCDYIVGVSFTFEETIHPTWKFWKGFKQYTYSAKLTGIPVTLESLLQEKAPNGPEFNTPVKPVTE